MAERRVVHRQYLPVRLPITFTATLWLLLDRLQVSQGAWATAAVLVSVLWISSIAHLLVETDKEPVWRD